MSEPGHTAPSHPDRQVTEETPDHQERDQAADAEKPRQVGGEAIDSPDERPATVGEIHREEARARVEGHQQAR